MKICPMKGKGDKQNRTSFLLNYLSMSEKVDKEKRSLKLDIDSKPILLVVT